MLSIHCIIGLGALIAWFLTSLGKCPDWVGGILLTIAVLLTCLPR